MGMMKSGKSALPGAKAGGSPGESALAYPNAALKVTPSAAGGKAKSKLNLFRVTASILKRGGGATAAPRPPEAFNGLPNGLPPTDAPGGSSDEGKKAEPRQNLPRDTGEVSLFHRRLAGSAAAAAAAGGVARNMYSLPEEAGDSGSSDQEDCGSRQPEGHRGRRERSADREEEAERDGGTSGSGLKIDQEEEEEEEEGEKEIEMEERESFLGGETVEEDYRRQAVQTGLSGQEEEGT